ncbi:sulfite exporter TauE/SafE family protein [Kitasatospora sp. NPDC004723]|uniref:sulfite exporter TauE/SafE family protein n=1 Tax=Kitasatospora sp. NPDC004723 TaxID=3154288 RepID=UPI0033A02979
MTTLLLALAAGAVVGLVLGGLGGGGGILAVPALIYLLGLSPAAATTAALLIVLATSISAIVAHMRAGTIRWRTALAFAAAGLLPAALTGAAAARLPQSLLTAAFALVAALAAVRMLRPPRPASADGPAATDGSAAGDGPAAADAPVPAGARPGRAAASGAGLGALTGLLGVGGGFLAVPALVGAVGLSMEAAVGTSLPVIAVNASASLVTRGGGAAGLDWAVIAPFTAAAVLGAWDGKRLAARLSGAVLQRTFAALLLGVAAVMGADALL